ncbi:SoxR reducing system RseC family protein [Thalassotalea fusca]
MVEEQATVVAIENNLVTVSSDLKTGCSGCQQVDNCGTGQVSKAFPQKKLTVQITSDLPLKVGDKVVLAIPESPLLSTAFQVYILPLIGLMTFAWLAQMLVEHQVLSHEIWAVLFGFVGGFAGYKLAKYRQNQPNVVKSLQPVIKKILPQSLPVTQIPR